MDKFNGQTSNDTPENLSVWCCENCQAVHFKAGNVLLNFTKTEFADLAHAMMEIYQQEFGGLEFYRLINLLTKDDDILSSSRIA